MVERFLETETLREIFRGDESVGSLQGYADYVSQLHHRFLESCLMLESPSHKLSIEEMLHFADDAEFLATQYTNPLFVDRVEGLPIEDLPSRQIVQDALALAGTIFEFLADMISLYESENLTNLPSDLLGTENIFVNTNHEELDQIHFRLGSSGSLYLKSALCYGLGRYESRTRVILDQLLRKVTEPEQPLTLQNCQRWADYLVCGLLGRNMHRISRLKQTVGEQVSSIRLQLRDTIAHDRKGIVSPEQMAQIQTAISLIEAVFLATTAFFEGDSGIMERSQTNLTNATKSAHQFGDYKLMWLIRTTSKVLARMWNDSPWVRLDGLITQRNYIKQLVEDGIVTLWSSQIAALEMRSKIGTLKGGYLDDQIRRVIIHMPTSAGKTLLAELAIARQSLSSAQNKCVYVAPSRALCDQIVGDLSDRLSRFGIRVTTVVSDSDSVGYESLLFSQANVVIVTPEKLGYLVRQRSPIVQSAGLFVFDEIHTISKPDRGWTYEEVVSFLLQHPQMRKAKMVFLSAVMPNHLAVQEWVDPEKMSETIDELWQPTRLLKGVIAFRPVRPLLQQRQATLPGDLIYVRHKTDLNSPFRINNIIQSHQFLKLKEADDGRHYLVRDRKLSDGEIHHAAAAVQRFARLGPVLVYLPRKVDATSFCDLALNLDLSFLTWKDGEKESFAEFQEFVKDRLPSGHRLIDALAHRIAFHHAGLPRDIRNEIEYAFRQGWIHVLAATTTLAEGVNLPVKTLVLSDYCQPRRWDLKNQKWDKPYPMSKSDFRNIAGRAGRALYETEGHVIIIQSIEGYPFGQLDLGFDDYLALEPNSPELDISSTFLEDGVLEYLSQLTEDVDNGRLSEEQLLFEHGIKDRKDKRIQLLNKLQTFTLLLQDQELVGDDEESFVRIFQGTFFGKQRPNDAAQIVGAFAHRSGRAIRSNISQSDRSLFAQTGLRISTCRTLMEKVRNYWPKHRGLEDFLSRALDANVLYEVAQVIYGLGDDEVDPQSLTLASEGKGSKTHQHLQDDSAFLVDWVIGRDTETMLSTHFSFIKEPSWRAEQFVDYTQQTLGYRAPWTLSAFWQFSKAVVQSYGIDLISTSLGREFVLLPAYAKFGVNSPAAALASTLGISPSILARKLGDLYHEQHKEKRYDYPEILHWLLTLEPRDLEGKIRPSYIRRLSRLLAPLSPLEGIASEYGRAWEVNFSIAGWQYYEGKSTPLKIGETVQLRHEPRNRYDPNAVEILTQSGKKLGYVPRYLARDVMNRVSISPINAIISNIQPLTIEESQVFVRCVDQW